MPLARSRLRTRRADLARTHLLETLTDLARTPGARVQVTVVPSDDVLYDDLVRVLDEIQRAKPPGVALGARARR
jgi:biopolymer transport protein ExbD